MATRKPAPSPARHAGMPNIGDADREQAWRAVQAFNKIRPQLQAFARRVTNNHKVIVEPTSETTSTNGSTIKIRPPLGLGDNAPHSRSDCGKRDSDGYQRCKACRAREVVDYYIFHEISHIAFETNVVFARTDNMPLVEQYFEEWHPKAVCQHARMALDLLSTRRDLMPIQVSHLMNEYMPLLFNAFDDTRVNARMFEARPGLRVIFKYNIQRVLVHGIEVGIEKHVSWRDANLNSQFIIGLRMASEGHDITGYLHPVVVEALADDRVQAIMAQVPVAKSANETFALSLEVFRHAQTLGFLVVDKCIPLPPAPPSPEDAGGRGDEHSDSDDKSDGSDNEPDEPDEPDEGDSSSSSDDQGDSSGQPTSGDGGESGRGDSEGDAGDSGSGSSENKSGIDGGSELKSPDREDREHKPDASGDSTCQPGDSEVPDPSGTSEPANLGDGTSGDNAEHEQSAGPDSTATGSSGDPKSDGQADSPNGTDSSREDSEDLESDLHGSNVANSDDEPNIQEKDSDSEGVQPGSQGGSHEEHSGGGKEGDSPDEESVGRNPEGSDAGEDDSSGGTEDGTPSSRTGDKAEASHEDSDAEDSGAEEFLDEPWDDTEGASESEGYDGHDPWSTPGGAEEPVFGPPSVPDTGPTGPMPDAGTPDDAARALARFLTHGSESQAGMLDDMAERDGTFKSVVGEEEGEELSREIIELLAIALMQVAYMDQASHNVAGYEFPTWPERRLRWAPDFSARDFMPPEGLIAKAELKARLIFEDNKRAKMLRNQKSGRINTRALAKRAPFADERLFLKKTLPGKRDYEVLIRVDISGSTDSYERNEKIKRAVFAQCMLLHRLGIPFSIYADTAYMGKLATLSVWNQGKDSDFYLYMLEVKKVTDPWNDLAKVKLANLRAACDNLDGHAMEYHRKAIEKSTATDKIIVCYTDGMMPAANYEEEREILEREVQICAKRGITLLGVGINTDSPKRYGMNTVRVDSDEDIIKVVEQLGRQLSGK